MSSSSPPYLFKSQTNSIHFMKGHTVCLSPLLFKSHTNTFLFIGGGVTLCLHLNFCPTPTQTAFLFIRDSHTHLHFLFKCHHQPEIPAPLLGTLSYSVPISMSTLYTSKPTQFLFTGGSYSVTSSSPLLLKS